MVKTREIDMTKGSIFKKILVCTIPIAIMSVLQTLFNATDIAIVGIYRGDDAVAAVGANTSLISLITGLFIGLSMGANVVLAKYKGKENLEGAKRVVGTSICVSIIAGVFLVIVGVLLAEKFLIIMGCPDDILKQATTYLTIYLTGMPVVMLYNFLASLLRAVGDTLRPMIFLIISGAMNVALNVLFVLGFGMNVEGVAYATLISQAFSAICCLVVVLKGKGYCRFNLRNFRIYKKELVEIIKIGVPSGIQGCLFSLSNVFLQSAVNGLGTETVAANAASTLFDAIVYFIGNSFAVACMSFVGQNYGAGDIKRVKKVIKVSVLMVIIGSFAFGGLIALFSKQLLGIVTETPEVNAIAQIRLKLLGLTYFMCGVMEVLSYSLRALGRSVGSMIICLIGACVFRIIWINTIFLLNKTYFMVYLCYPITWMLTISALVIYIIKTIKNIENIMP